MMAEARICPPPWTYAARAQLGAGGGDDGAGRVGAVAGGDRASLAAVAATGCRTTTAALTSSTELAAACPQDAAPRNQLTSASSPIDHAQKNPPFYLEGASPCCRRSSPTLKGMPDKNNANEEAERKAEEENVAVR